MEDVLAGVEDPFALATAREARGPVGTRGPGGLVTEDLDGSNECVALGPLGIAGGCEVGAEVLSEVEVLPAVSAAAVVTCDHRDAPDCLVEGAGELVAVLAPAVEMDFDVR